MRAKTPITIVPTKKNISITLPLNEKGLIIKLNIALSVMIYHRKRNVKE